MVGFRMKKSFSREIVKEDIDNFFKTMSFLIPKHLKLTLEQLRFDEKWALLQDRDFSTSLSLRIVNALNHIRVESLNELGLYLYAKNDYCSFRQHIPGFADSGQFLHEIKYLSQDDLLGNIFFDKLKSNEDFSHFEVSRDNLEDRLMAIDKDGKFFVFGYLSKPNPIDLPEWNANKYKT